MFVKTILAVSALAATSGAAMAEPVAILSDVAGTVLVDQGRGFVRISGDSPIIAGSRVMLSRDGKGVLVYDGAGGCRLKLSANTITTVHSITDCHPVLQVAGQAAPLVAATTTTAATTTPTPLFIVAGLSMAGMEAVAQTIAQQEQEPPASQ